MNFEPLDRPAAAGTGRHPGHRSTRARLVLDGQTVAFQAGESLQIHSEAKAPPDKWTHVVLSRANGIIRLLVNGSFQATAHWTDKFTPQFLGKDPAAGLHGTLDDFVLYDRALDEPEIAQLLRH